MSKDPTDWGPKFWYVLHSAAYALDESPTESQREAFSALIASYPNLLPCDACREHLKELLATTPAIETVLGSRTDTFIWTVRLHNNVNKMLGKPTFSVKEAESALRGSGGGSPVVMIILVIITVVAALLLLWWAAWSRRR